jgi:hypothetical protein
MFCKGAPPRHDLPISAARRPAPGVVCLALKVLSEWRNVHDVHVKMNG